LPISIIRTQEQIRGQAALLDIRKQSPDYYVEPEQSGLVADPVLQYMNKEQLEKAIHDTKRKC